MATHNNTDRRQYLADTPIAIVGVSALFPQAHDVREFWTNIVQGTDCTQDVPETHWKLEDYYDPDPSVPDKTYAKRGGFLPTTPFHPMDFGIPPNTIEVTDVLQLLSLQVAGDLLRDAGATGSAWYDSSRTGVVLGITGANQLTQPLSARLQTPVLKEVVRSFGIAESDAQDIADRFVLAFAPWEENSFPGMLGNVVAGRIANRYDLGGINCTVDAACASSLAALRTAIDELVSGRSDLMIAGGCDAENTILMYMCFSKTPAFSKSGVIRPFDAEADGTLIGEGMGMLALKRLDDAEADGDRIYAVIRGMGASSDGRFKSIYAPRASGQSLALSRAYEDARFGADTVALYEAHGTGTAVGDMTELSALSGLLTEHGTKLSTAAVGSVKSQIGHTKAAAGAAGLIKLAMALHQKVLPPTINVSEPNPQAFADSPLYVNAQARPWLRRTDGVPRRAAVSSFGFGGTNFHVVLEEHRAAAPDGALAAAPRVHFWHAADAAALSSLLQDDAPCTDPGQAQPGDARLAFVAESPDDAEALRAEAVQLLSSGDPGQAWTHPKGIQYRPTGIARDAKVAVTFPGQGSQYVGMAREALVAIPQLREYFEDVNVMVSEGLSVADVVYPPHAFDDESRRGQQELLTRTQFAQPAIGALSLAAFRWLSDLGLRPSAAIGHSFGELTALAAAGVLDDRTFTRLAVTRGAAMQQAAVESGPSGMVAVPLSEDQVQAQIGELSDVWICNINSPTQTVIGGAPDALDRLTRSWAEQGVRCTRLPVAAAFHTPYVTAATERFAAAVAESPMQRPRMRVLSDVGSAEYSGDLTANSQLLSAQLGEAVQFGPQVKRLVDEGYEVFVEVGPRRALTGLVQSIAPDAACISLDDGTGSAQAFVKAVASMAVLGLPIRELNSWLAPAAEPVQHKGPAIELCGMNYVPPARAQAYQDALAEGGNLGSAPEGSDRDAEQTKPGPLVESTVGPAPSVVTDDERALRTALADALDAHRDALRACTDAVARLNSAGTPAAVRNHEAKQPAAEPIEIASEPDEQPAAAPTESATSVSDVPATAAPEVPEVTAPVAAVTAEAGPEGSARSEGSAQPDASAVAGSVSDAGSDPVSSEADSGSGAASSVVAGALLEAVSAKTGYPVEMLELGMDVEADLGIDSIKRVEILGELAQRFPAATSVAPEALGELRTLADIVGVLSQATGSEGSGDSVAVAAVTAEAGPEGSAQPDASAVAGSVSDAGSDPVSSEADSGSGAASSVVAGALLEAVSAKTGYPVEMLELGMDVEADLGIDSIKRVEILGELAQRFPAATSVAPEALGELRTLADIVGVLSQATGAEKPDDSAGASADDSSDSAGSWSPPHDDPPIDPVVEQGNREVPTPVFPKVPGVTRTDVTRREIAHPDRLVGAWRSEPVAALITDAPLASAALREELVAQGWRVVQVRPVGSRDDIGAQLPDDLDLCVVHAGTGAGEGVEEQLARVIVAAGAAVPRLRTDKTSRAGLVVTTRLDGQTGSAASADADAVLGGLVGLTRTLPSEVPGLFSRLIDVDRKVDDGTWARLVIDELWDPVTDLLDVGYDVAGHRSTTSLREPVDHPVRSEPLQAGDVVVVTGGARGVTAACIAALADSVPATYLLVGRSELQQEAAHTVGVEPAELKQAIMNHLRDSGQKPTPRAVQSEYSAVVAQREIRATLSRLQQSGAQAHYLSADVTDADSIARALGEWAARVTVLVHGAGVLADKKVVDKDPDAVSRVVRTKVSGLRTLRAALSSSPVRQVIGFCSVAGLFGNLGQADYAVANEAVARYLAAWSREEPGVRTTALCWGAWDGGMVTGPIREMFLSRGIVPIPVETGAGMFVEQFTAPRRGDQTVLLGPRAPLTQSDARQADAPAGAVVERRLNGLDRDPALDAHRIEGRIVLPVAAIVGAALLLADEVVGLRDPAHVSVRDVRVLHGVRIEPNDPRRLRFDFRVGGEGCTVEIDLLSADGSVQPAYRLTICARADERPVRQELPSGLAGVVTGYADGTLFHGSALQGLATMRSLGDGSVLTARLPADAELPGWSTPGYQAAWGDLMLQAALCWARDSFGARTLPMHLGKLELWGAVPDGAYLVVSDVEQRPVGALCTVTALDATGTPCLRLSGIELVTVPATHAASNHRSTSAA